MLLYMRELPGGGVVTIEEVALEATPGHRARVLVERRADQQRRAGHEPPVIAEAAGESAALVFRELYAIAADNVAVARGLRQWQGARRAE